MKLSKQTSAQFLADVTLMTDDQAGRYFKLVCLLTQKDILRKEEFDVICGGDEVVASMFEDEGGYFILKSTAKTKKKRKIPSTPEESEKELMDSMRPFVAEFGQKMCRKFFNYWTERTRDGKLNNYMKKETWDTKRRLENWRDRNYDREEQTVSVQPTTTSIKF